MSWPKALACVGLGLMVFGLLRAGSSGFLAPCGCGKIRCGACGTDLSDWINPPASKEEAP